jgi:hypothetical protein
MVNLFLGILLGIFIGKYLLTILDLGIEYFNVRVSQWASIYQAKMERLTFKLSEECSPKQPAIGFAMKDNEMGIEDTDDDDDEESRTTTINSKGSIGFKL